MTRTFAMLAEFEKQWAKMGLDDDDLSRLQNELMRYPLAGDVIQGTGGLRKLRFAFEHRGKSGSIRVAYVDFAVYEKIYLVTAYPKNEKSDLTPKECSDIKKAIALIGATLKGEKP